MLVKLNCFPVDIFIHSLWSSLCLNLLPIAFLPFNSKIWIVLFCRIIISEQKWRWFGTSGIRASLTSKGICISDVAPLWTWRINRGGYFCWNQVYLRHLLCQWCGAECSLQRPCYSPAHVSVWAFTWRSCVLFHSWVWLRSSVK